MTQEEFNLIERLRKRAEIRQRIRTRGVEDRIARDLLEAAQMIEQHAIQLQGARHQIEQLVREINSKEKA